MRSLRAAALAGTLACLPASAGAQDGPIARAALGLASRATAYYPSRATFQLATVSAGPSTVVLNGYYADGDGGRQTVTRLASCPTAPLPAWDVQSADGACWQLTERVPNEKMFGGRGGVTSIFGVGATAGGLVTAGGQLPSSAVGKTVVVPGAGPSGAVLVATITAATGNSATVSPAPSTTLASSVGGLLGYSDTAAIQAVEDYLQAMGGGQGEITVGSHIADPLIYHANVVLKPVGGTAAGSNIVSLYATCAGSVQVYADASTIKGPEVDGLDLVGLGTACAEAGIKLAGSYPHFEYVQANGFGEQGVITDSAMAGAVARNIAGSQDLRNHQTAATSTAFMGVVEGNGADNRFDNWEGYGSQSGVISSGLYNIGVLDRGVNNWISSPTAEQSDCGIMTMNYDRVLFARGERNFGPGICGLYGQWIAPYATGNSLAGNGLYNGFQPVQNGASPITGILIGAVNDNGGGSVNVKYAFGDPGSGDQPDGQQVVWVTPKASGYTTSEYQVATYNPTDVLKAWGWTHASCSGYVNIENVGSLVCNDGSAVSQTGFLAGVAGQSGVPSGITNQELTEAFNGNQTVVASSSMILLGGQQSWKPPSGTVIHWRHWNGKWYQTPMAGDLSNLLRVREVTSGTSDTATAADTDIVWRSTSTAAKAEAIPVCAAANSGAVLHLKDGAGTAASYAITVTPGGGTIDGASSATIGTNRGALELHCDGAATDWMIQ